MKKISTMILAILLCILAFGSIKANASEIGLQELPPRLVIDSYEISEGQLIPGAEFTLKLTIHNTNPHIAAENVMLSYYSNDTTVYPVFGESNQKFVGQIDGGKSAQVELHMSVAKAVNKEVATINIALEYASSKSNASNMQSSLMLPISANCNMEVSSLSVAKSTTVGAKSLVSVVYVNNGLVEIKNATMHLSGDILDNQTTIALGDLTAGAQAMKDCYVNFQKEGEQKLLISFTYEDGEGNTFSIPESDYNVMVNPSSMNVYQEGVFEETSESLEQWQLLAIVGGISLALVIILVLVKLRERHKK